jgi:hypothetical protein
VARLAEALARVGASVREPGQRRLAATRDLLTASATAIAGGRLRLRTDHGPLDVLWRLHDGRGYRELLERSVVLSDGERELRVVSIEALIEIKEAAGRARDREDVEYLKLILRRTRGPS